MASQAKNILEKIDGIQEVGVFSIMGQTNLEFRIDLTQVPTSPSLEVFALRFAAEVTFSVAWDEMKQF